MFSIFIAWKGGYRGFVGILNIRILLSAVVNIYAKIMFQLYKS